MTPTEYEQYVASLLSAEGWDATVSAPQRDFGLDIVCEQPGRRLGVQVKMYGKVRPVNAQIVMQLHGAAKYQNCEEVMLATDGRLLRDASDVAAKLNIEVRYVPIPSPIPPVEETARTQGQSLSFDVIWTDSIMPLAGQVLRRSNGKTNEILHVDWGGIERMTSNGQKQMIGIEIFRWAIERLLAGQVVLRDEINEQYGKRASSGIVLILAQVPIFQETKVQAKGGLRLRADQ